MGLNTTVYWIRHAPTHSSALVGWTDIQADLSDSNTIYWLQNNIPEDAIIVSSDLQRARMTADAIAGRRLRLPDSYGLREINFGVWEGKTYEEVSQSHPEESSRFWNDSVNAETPDGESWNTLTERAAQFIKHTMKQFPGRTLVAVSHYGTILSQANQAKNAKDFNLFSRTVSNLSLTHMSYQNGVWHLHEFSKLPT